MKWKTAPLHRHSEVIVVTSKNQGVDDAATPAMTIAANQDAQHRQRYFYFVSIVLRCRRQDAGQTLPQGAVHGQLAPGETRCSKPELDTPIDTPQRDTRCSTLFGATILKGCTWSKTEAPREGRKLL